MKIVCVNYTFDPLITNPDVLLDRYQSLVGWASALKAAGAQVSVVQRFGSNIERTRNAIPFLFVRDPTLKNGGLFDRALQVNAAITAAQPDIVHVNGLQFARQAWQLKKLLRVPSRRFNVPILLQDHANQPPRRWPNRWTLGRALRRMDAFSFVSRAQAKPWLDAGLLRTQQPVFELMEGSSNFRLTAQSAAREQTGLTGDPLCLWVGRLNANKDPLTILRGFAKTLPSVPNARLAMVYSSIELLPEVRRWLNDNPTIAGHVLLLGQRPHAELENIYNSADMFLLGSHHEGSGYAVIEALACGVIPIITAIPSFRVLTGEGKVGALWPSGDAEALAHSLKSQYPLLQSRTRLAVRAHFEARFHWNAIAHRAVDAYQSLLSAGD